jgi:hypothetical protein
MKELNLASLDIESILRHPARSRIDLARGSPRKTYFNNLLGPFFCPWSRFGHRLVVKGLPRPRKRASESDFDSGGAPKCLLPVSKARLESRIVGAIGYGLCGTPRSADRGCFAGTFRVPSSGLPASRAMGQANDRDAEAQRRHRAISQPPYPKSATSMGRVERNRRSRLRS